MRMDVIWIGIDRLTDGRKYMMIRIQQTAHME
jgi:hypothetical protein